MGYDIPADHHGSLPAVPSRAELRDPHKPPFEGAT